jgi:protoporphyrinogen oxidase
MEGSNEVRKAGHVIVAADPAAAARLMPEELATQRDFLDSVMYSPIPSVVLFLDRPLDRDVWVYFNDIKQRRDFMVCIDQLAKMPEMVPSGKSILWLAPAHPKSLRLANLPDAELIKTALEDAEAMVPGVGNMVDRVEVFRHPYGVPQFPPGAYKALLEFKNGIKPLKGISFVSDIFGGHYMEASLMSAKNAVERLRCWGGCTGCAEEKLPA